MRSAPFSRVQAFIAAMAAALGSSDRSVREQQMKDLGPYRSRGKGRGLQGKRYGSTNKFVPHQGRQEIARRQRQAAAMEAKAARRSA